MNIDDLRPHLAPTGRLRAAINVGNPILAHLDPSGHPAGVSVDLARALAERLGVEADLTAVEAAAKSVNAVTAERADVGFFAVDPLRADGIAFTAPYLLIEGSYLVRDDSPIRANEAVDRELIFMGRLAKVGLMYVPLMT
jgi:polar amino acid transport system substrate-binding protein